MNKNGIMGVQLFGLFTDFLWLGLDALLEYTVELIVELMNSTFFTKGEQEVGQCFIYEGWNRTQKASRVSDDLNEVLVDLFDAYDMGEDIQYDPVGMDYAHSFKRPILKYSGTEHINCQIKLIHAYHTYLTQKRCGMALAPLPHLYRKSKTMSSFLGLCNKPGILSSLLSNRKTLILEPFIPVNNAVANKLYLPMNIGDSISYRGMRGVIGGMAERRISLCTIGSSCGMDTSSDFSFDDDVFGERWKSSYKVGRSIAIDVGKGYPSITIDDATSQFIDSFDKRINAMITQIDACESSIDGRNLVLEECLSVKGGSRSSGGSQESCNCKSILQEEIHPSVTREDVPGPDWQSVLSWPVERSTAPPDDNGVDNRLTSFNCLRINPNVDINVESENGPSTDQSLPSHPNLDVPPGRNDAFIAQWINSLTPTLNVGDPPAYSETIGVPPQLIIRRRGPPDPNDPTPFRYLRSSASSSDES